MGFRIVIRAFSLRRDMSSSLLLKAQLERMGCSVFIASSRNYFAVLKRWRPQAVIINTQSVVKKSREILPDCVIVLWHAEGGEIKHWSEAYSLNLVPNLIDNIDYIFTFGEEGLKFFDDIFPEIQCKWKVAGNSRLETAKFNPDLIEARQGSSSIGMPTRFSQINHHAGLPPYKILQNPNSEWSFVYQAKAYVALVSAVDRILNDTDLSISIRPHPNENIYNYRFLQSRFPDRIEVDTSYDFAAWAAKQKAIVGPSTTAILEAYVLRVPTVNIEAMGGISEVYEEQGSTRLMRTQSSSYFPKNGDELIDILRGDIKVKPRHPDVDDLLRNSHNWFSDKSATKTVAEETVNLVQERKVRAGPYFPKPIIHVEDRIRFAKGWFQNRLITNMSFQYGYHEIPTYYSELLANIDAGRRLDPAIA